jgi:hypothetical protein
MSDDSGDTMHEALEEWLEEDFESVTVDVILGQVYVNALSQTEED